MHRHLQEDVAELFDHLAVVVAAIYRLQKFVRLLEQVGTERLRRLLAIPGAAVGSAQTARDLEDSFHARRVRAARRVIGLPSLRRAGLRHGPGPWLIHIALPSPPELA